jgi:ABC-type multidrug transport system permease subunit
MAQLWVCISSDSTSFLTRGLTRHYSILWVYIIFNVFAALALYWLVRVPKNKLGKKTKKE